MMDQIINEIDVRFRNQNTKLYAAISALQPENSNFGCKMVQPPLDLVDRTMWKQNLMFLRRTSQNLTMMRRHRKV